MVLQGIKPRLFNRLNKISGRWVAELPMVLWSLRTIPSRATGYTHFFMVYGAEAVLPTDLDYGAPRVMQYIGQEAKEYLEDALDQLEEARDIALLHSAKYQQALRRYHSRRIKVRAFNVGDLVPRLVQSNKDHHKLSPLWEGTYVITEVLSLGTYKLVIANGKVFTNA
jgi:hypothetical protein